MNVELPEPIHPGVLVQAELTRAGRTQLSTAKQMGYHPKYMHRVCRGERMPSARFVFLLGRVLNRNTRPLWDLVSSYYWIMAQGDLIREEQRRYQWSQESENGSRPRRLLRRGG